MGYQDDYVMRTISDLVRAIARLALGKNEIDYALPDTEDKYSDTDRIYRKLRDLVDAGEINEAENQLYENLDEKVAAMRAMKEHFIEGVKQIPDTTIHGLYDETSAPHIISVGFAGIRSEVLLHALEDKGIYVSSGSACASNHPQISGVLKGIGAGQQFLDATLRFSLSEFNTMEEIDYTLDTLYNIVPMLRKYTRH